MSSASYAADLGLYLRPASMGRATDVSVSKMIAAMISQMEKSIVVKSGSLVWQRACEGLLLLLLILDTLSQVKWASKHQGS